MSIEAVSTVLDFNKVIKETGIRLCLDCGKCTVVCPVNRYNEEYNPRRIVQDALLGHSDVYANVNIWQCLGCNMCVERCNYKVAFPDFVRALRSKAQDNGIEVQCAHGGSVQSVMRCMSKEGLRQNRLDWLPDDIVIDQQSTTAFFTGCTPYFDVLFNEMEINTLEGTKSALRLLNKAEVPFTLLPNERCCGWDLLSIGDIEGFLALANANMEEIKNQGIKEIITSCPEGFYTLKHEYPKYVEGWNIPVRHITEVLAEKVADGSLKLGTLNKKVTYHDPCTLGRYSRIFEQPRNLLEAVSGLELVEMKDNRETALCCGASPWAYCGYTNKQIQRERLEQAAETGAEVLVTACPKCEIHLRCAQKNAGQNEVSRIEICNLYTLAAQSL